MRQHLPLIFILLVAICLAGYGMNRAELQEWDEARRGINALRMLQSGDYWNYSFLDVDDTFNTKPPLFTWLLAGSFRVFGVNLFALRLVSLLALLGFIAVVFRFLRKRTGEQIASLTILVLLVCNGITGFHVARSGDTDMLFVFFLTVGLLGAYQLLEDGRLRSGLVAILGLGLAFLTKGLAVALVLPGLLMFGVIKRRSFKIASINFILLILAALMMALVCASVCFDFGQETQYESGYGNLGQAVFWHDGLTRFTDGSLEQWYQWDFLPVSLDVGFSPWIYVLYLGVVWALVKKGFGGVKRMILADGFLLFSLLVVISVSILLLVSQNKHRWYIAPMLLFLAYPVALLLKHAVNWKRLLIVPIGLVFLFVFVMKTASVHNQVDKVGEMVEAFSDELKAADSLLVSRHTPQHLLFHCYLANPAIRIVTKNKEADLVLRKGKCMNGVLGYCLVKDEL